MGMSPSISQALAPRTKHTAGGGGGGHCQGGRPQGLAVWEQGAPALRGPRHRGGHPAALSKAAWPPADPSLHSTSTSTTDSKATGWRAGPHSVSLRAGVERGFKFLWSFKERELGGNELISRLFNERRGAGTGAPLSRDCLGLPIGAGGGGTSPRQPGGQWPPRHPAVQSAPDIPTEAGWAPSGKAGRGWRG